LCSPPGKNSIASLAGLRLKSKLNQISVTEKGQRKGKKSLYIPGFELHAGIPMSQPSSRRASFNLT